MYSPNQPTSTSVHVFTEPADIDIGEARYPGPQDGAEVITLDWKEFSVVVKKDAAVDTAYGILHLASEPLPSKKEPLLDGAEMLKGFVWVTLLVTWCFICWNALTYWMG
jgi:hypothetical protein